MLGHKWEPSAILFKASVADGSIIENYWLSKFLDKIDVVCMFMNH